MVRALVPGDAPKIQVKLALPEDCDEFSAHPLCQKGEEDVYRLGNQRFGLATIVPPSFGAFTLCTYHSDEHH